MTQQECRDLCFKYLTAMKKGGLIAVSSLEQMVNIQLSVDFALGINHSEVMSDEDWKNISSDPMYQRIMKIIQDCPFIKDDPLDFSKGKDIDPELN